MIDSYQASYTLKPKELEAVYAISKIVSEEVDLDKALERIIHIAREVFIFDSAVIYVRHAADEPEAVYAKAIGRGKSSGSNLPWGETAAQETLKSGEIFIQESEISPGTARLDQSFYLSLPMLIGGNITGALVFIRFGGPSYNTDHISIAEFITIHVSQLFEQKRLLEQVTELQAKQKLAQLQDEFVAMVSHELKTPLGFIKGYTTTLLREDTSWDYETQKEFLSIIDDEADQLSEQIENLLNSFRLKSQSANIYVESIPLADFFKGLLEKLSKQEINLEIDLEISPSDLLVYADPKMLAQVANNLISNASKYAPNATLEIRAYQKEDAVLLTFRDNGPGIPPVHLENLFKQFYRVPERSGGVRGTGLGLFICKQIIDAHKGEIWVESILNQGTSFFVRLPNAPKNNLSER
jgi:K+-sensing histidine kinase KdpD